MHLPGLPSLFFLFVLLFLLPWSAYRSALRFRAARAVARDDGGSATPAFPSRELIWINTLISLALIGGLAWWVGHGFGYPVFALPALGWREIGAAVLALAGGFGIRAVVRASRTEEERRGLAVYRMVPRTGREWALWTAAILAAGVAEEAAYRGVGMAILWYALGNPWLAALISASAFALAHWVQGWKSGLAVFAIGLVMQGLVAVTGTLVPAMIVHALYDYAAGILIARQAKRDWKAPASASP